MKKNLLVAALLMSALGAFGQGSINFNNRVISGAGPTAPIFGVDPANPTQQKQGNPTSTWNGTSGPTPIPAGTQTYAGAALRGTGFTATLWAANATKADDQLALISTTTFRVSTSSSVWGFINAPVPSPVVPDTGSSNTERAKFQMRVWDNQGGTITTWDQVLAAPDRIAHGWSTIFTVNSNLGGGTTLPPNLVGLESFQLFTVPEPSVIALGMLGAGCLFMLRRRK